MKIVVFVTTKNIAQAKKIARGLLAKKLAACVNILPIVQSLFRWQGKVDSAQESLLIIKSTKARFQKLAQCVKALHSYQVPEIIALPIVAGNKEYLDWLQDSCSPKGE